jgi:hypothetical protein
MRAGQCLRCGRLVRGLHVMTLVTPTRNEPYLLCGACLAAVGVAPSPATVSPSAEEVAMRTSLRVCASLEEVVTLSAQRVRQEVAEAVAQRGTAWVAFAPVGVPLQVVQRLLHEHTAPCDHRVTMVAADGREDVTALVDQARLAPGGPRVLPRAASPAEVVWDAVILDLGPGGSLGAWQPGAEVHGALSHDEVRGARLALVVATGRELADVVREVLYGPEDPVGLPAQRVLLQHENPLLLCDKPAGLALRGMRA